MAIKTIDQNPTITDKIVFSILTPDASGCFSTDPYQVNNVTIYYVQRDFVNSNLQQYNNQIQNDSLAAKLAAAKAAACTLPNDANLAAVTRLQNQLDSSTVTDLVYYTQAVPVGVFGTPNTPAWIGTDVDNAYLDHLGIGNFTLDWTPLGMREGDYFICWTWTPNPAGSTLSAYNFFHLASDTTITTTLPTHVTDPKKYPTLFNRYLPEMFKQYISNNDLTPQTLQGFNNVLADGFKFLEDMANQILDLIDANGTPEVFLPLLGNLFGLKLRSNDPTLWRRQIKQAIPLYKQKGTLPGLQAALAEAGIQLNKFTKLWQVISQYTWQELFDVAEDDQSTFTLSKTVILPIDTDNFEIYYRGKDSNTWEMLTPDYVTFPTSDTMTWIGENLSTMPISLSAGDSIRVVYEVNDVPNDEQQGYETYLRTLPLMDQRDERNQIYPLKNWNVRLIEEDDVLFDALIPTRFPYVDPVIYGKVRTEFPYSEKIYNMDEFNGSKRDSTVPCDIDNNFIDACQACQSSKFTLDINIEDISNDRILEAQDIVNEYVPFHAQLHSMNIGGMVNDFVQPPVENIMLYLTFFGQENVIAGNAPLIFNRTMEDGANIKEVRRDVLASSTLVATGIIATAYNDNIVLYCPDVDFVSLGIDTSNNVLEILAPSSEAGVYTVSSPTRNTVVVAGASEPFVSTVSFTFKLSNVTYQNSSVVITQDNINTISDTSLDFIELDAKSTWDVDNEPTYTGGAWKISFNQGGFPASSNHFNILNILPNGTIILDDPTNLLPTSGSSNVTYSLLNDANTVVATSNTGIFTVDRRSVVDVSSDSAIQDIRHFVNAEDWLLYSGTQYQITGFVPDQPKKFYIKSYLGSNISGVAVKVYRRLANNAVGYLDYRGLELQTVTNYETTLPILNGANAPTDPNQILNNDSFKENYLIVTGGNYYVITQIDNNIITLNGPPQSWTTLGAGGTSIVFDLYHYTKNPISILPREYPPMPGYTFNSIDRSGTEIIVEDTGMSMYLASVLNKGASVLTETVKQKEAITVRIEYTDGRVEERRL